VDIGLLGDAVLLAGNGAGAVGAVAVAVDVLVAGGDGLAPAGTASKSTWSTLVPVSMT
jgi:hypothetical protein